MPTDAATLRASLERHNDTFESLLKLIPAKYYIAQDNEEQIASKYQKHSKKQKAPKQALKEASKKAKKEKLDPANHKTVIDIQNESLALAAFSSKGKRKREEEEDGDDDDEHGEDGSDSEGGGNVDMSGFDNDDDASGSWSDDDEEEEEISKRRKQKHDAPSSPDKIIPMPVSGGIESLREKLHARMVALRRGSGPYYSYGHRENSVTGNEASGRDGLLEERRNQRAALRERRRKETREKIRREKEARGKKGKDKERGQQQKTQGKLAKTQLLVPDTTGPQGDLATISFSALAGSGPSSSKKTIAHIKTSSNPTQALEQLTLRKERLSSMAEGKRAMVEEKDMWAKAEARMEGVKVHDDEGRLKKAVKKKEKEKVKGKKQWEERKEQLTTSMAARQKKRGDNIAMRNERRSEKRKGIKPSAKKARPGFEGKSFGGKGKAGGKPKKK